MTVEDRLAERPGDGLGEGADRALVEANRLMAEARAGREADTAARRKRSEVARAGSSDFVDWWLRTRRGP